MTLAFPASVHSFELARPICGWCRSTSCVCERIRLEPCACGGQIAARTEDPQDQQRAVMEHNGTSLHAQWRLTWGA